MNRIITIICIVTTLFIPSIGICAGGASKTLTLADAILLALRYNPSVRSAEIQRVVDKFNLRLAENALEVQYALSGSASYTRANLGKFGANAALANLSPSANITTPIGTNISLSMNNQFTGGSPFGTSYSPAIQLGITQPLLQGAGTLVSPASVGLYNAKIQEQVAKLSLKSALIQVVTQVIQQYVTVVQAENTLTSQELSLTRARTTVEQYKALIKAGRNAPTDIVQPQADVATQEVNLQQSKNNLQQAYQGLLNLLGLDPMTPITVSKHVTFLTECIPTLAESIRLALLHNIAYQQQLLSFNISRRSLLVAKDRALPLLNLQVNTSLANGAVVGTGGGFQGFFSAQNVSPSASLTLNVPIDNYQVKSGIVNARVQLEQAKINLDGSKRQIETQVTATYNSLISQKLQISQSKEAVRLAQNSLEIAKEKQKFGRITPFEVTSLQNAQLNAEISDINSEISYLVTLSGFDQLLGMSLDRWKINIRY